MVDIVEKQCTRCKMTLSVKNFHKDASKKGGFCNRCKSCCKKSAVSESVPPGAVSVSDIPTVFKISVPKYFNWKSDQHWPKPAGKFTIRGRLRDYYLIEDIENFAKNHRGEKAFMPSEEINIFRLSQQFNANVTKVALKYGARSLAT